jgi:hypothetical protein
MLRTARLVRWIDVFKIPSLPAYTPEPQLAALDIFDRFGEQLFNHDRERAD